MALRKFVTDSPYLFCLDPYDKPQKGCVDLRYASFYVSGSGQCCAVNPMKDEATLVNPLVGGKYWKAMDGERAYGVKCL